MGLQDGIKKTLDNAGDALHEAGHRTSAEAERLKRKLAGDEMTPGEKVGSTVTEGKERVLAEVDKAKRDGRNL
jgi:hypothetical protein